MRNSIPRTIRIAVIALLTASFLLQPGNAPAAQAQEPQNVPGPSLSVTAAPGETQVRWLAAPSAADAAASTTQLPLQPYGAHLLPMQTFTVRSDGDFLPAATASHLVDVAWTGQLPAAPELSPPALDWEPAPWLQPAETAPLPDAPLFLLRTGRMRGVQIAVYAFSEVYQDSSGALRRVVEFNAVIPGSQPAGDLSALLPSGEPDAIESQAAPALTGAVSPPTNNLAGRRAVKVFVAQAGIQHITADELAAAGLPNPSASKLRLYYRGTEGALQVIDNNRDGVLSGGESLRFYAPTPGDVWNQEDVYWLIEAANDGLRMATRNVAPKQAEARTVALETGVWRLNKLYESTIPGADGDNWFHLRGNLTPSTTSANAPSFQANLGVRLPLAENAPLPSVFTLAVTAAETNDTTQTQVPHRLQLGGGSVAYTDGNADWIVDFGQGKVQNFSRRIETGGRTAALAVKLLPNANGSAVFFDEIRWEQPVRLALGGKGAAFRGVAGTWRYQVGGAPENAWLYDVTDPLRPQVLTSPSAAETSDPLYLPLLSAPMQVDAAAESQTELIFEDGPDVHDYLVAGAGTLHRPRLEVHNPVTFSGGAHAVYIAPRLFHDALQPLVAHRTAQGYQVKVVDVQAIYDAWSYGFVDPTAIRNFLRYAVSAWSPSPVSAVLVGDGTYDPLNYLGFDNPNHIPPYLADVDPWIGVTACENCYAQLDGDDPLTGDGQRVPPAAGPAFLIDIWIGRLPVADTGELENVVDKIVRYETDRNVVASWRNRSIQISDDYIIQLEDGRIVTDDAGNFWQFIEGIIELQPARIDTARVYYNTRVDPAVLSPDLRDWYERVLPWLEANQSAAQAKTLNTLAGGAGLATFTGHSNHWQWARMGDTAGYDYRLFGLTDVDLLANRDRLFIGLSMTCYTAQFTIPAAYHGTLDERLVLHPGGGAVAMWGPSGLSVATGHDALQVGFYRALWKAPPLRGTLGALTQAGYNHVVLDKSCCQDVARTFLLLGDPLTPARVRPLDILHLPQVNGSASPVLSAQE